MPSFLEEKQLQASGIICRPQQMRRRFAPCRNVGRYLGTVRTHSCQSFDSIATLTSLSLLLDITDATECNRGSAVKLFGKVIRHVASSLLGPRGYNETEDEDLYRSPSFYVSCRPISVFCNMKLAQGDDCMCLFLRHGCVGVGSSFLSRDLGSTQDQPQPRSRSFYSRLLL